jgi:broad specificity phosphatase PhoE
MSDFWFIRHGQAGTRLKYDTLSDIGHQQARLLGEYLSRHGAMFSRIVIGGLERHRETAESVLDAYKTYGATIPEPIVDADWNEFDLDAVYRCVAPQLSKTDEGFAQGYEAMQKQVAEQGTVAESLVNRRWNPCDGAVVKAWVTGQCSVDCETWVAFRDRIRGALEKLVTANPEGDVAIFTSATPTAICLAQAMGLDDRQMFNLAGVMINSAISTLRFGEGGALRMFNFNTVPHLDDAALRTHR